METLQSTECFTVLQQVAFKSRLSRQTPCPKHQPNNIDLSIIQQNYLMRKFIQHCTQSVIILFSMPEFIRDNLCFKKTVTESKNALSLKFSNSHDHDQWWIQWSEY